MTSTGTARSRKDIKRRTAEQAFLTEWLKLVVDGAAKAFGSRCEVVLHDLTHLDRSIVKIVNGHVTGRTVGDTISEQGLKQFKNFPNVNLHSSLTATKDGRHLKSTTMVSKNDKGQSILALSINFDVTDMMSFNMAMRDMFGITDEGLREELVDTFGGEVVSTLNEIADNVIQRAGKTIPAMTRRGRIEIVRQLENQGYFLIKGAVKFIAGKLNVSASTIYGYLDTIQSEKSDMSVPTQLEKVA